MRLQGREAAGISTFVTALHGAGRSTSVLDAADRGYNGRAVANGSKEIAGVMMVGDIMTFSGSDKALEIRKPR